MKAHFGYRVGAVLQSKVRLVYKYIIGVSSGFEDWLSKGLDGDLLCMYEDTYDLYFYTPGTYHISSCQRSHI